MTRGPQLPPLVLTTASIVAPFLLASRTTRHSGSVTEPSEDCLPCLLEGSTIHIRLRDTNPFNESENEIKGPDTGNLGEREWLEARLVAIGEVGGVEKSARTLALGLLTCSQTFFFPREGLSAHIQCAFLLHCVFSRPACEPLAWRSGDWNCSSSGTFQHQ